MRFLLGVLFGLYSGVYTHKNYPEKTTFYFNKVNDKVDEIIELTQLKKK